MRKLLLISQRRSSSDFSLLNIDHQNRCTIPVRRFSFIWMANRKQHPQKPIENIGIGPSEIGQSAGTKKVCQKGLTEEGEFSIIIEIPVK